MSKPITSKYETIAKRVLLISFALIVLDLLLSVLSIGLNGASLSAQEGTPVISDLSFYSDQYIWLPALAVNAVAQIFLLFSSLFTRNQKIFFAITLGTALVTSGLLQYAWLVCDQANSSCIHPDEDVFRSFAGYIVSALLISSFLNVCGQAWFFIKKPNG